MVRQRRKPASDTVATRRKPPTADMTIDPAAAGAESAAATRWSTRTQWIFFAIASGVCAALNGAFAKLTTTELTTKLSNAIANLVGFSKYENIIEYVIRVTFFTLNLVFNGVMWSLFTTALARGTSATQVSIMNTSTNFIVTALLGIAVFSERLPPLWWAGAALLVVGNVIAGRKNDGDDHVSTDAAAEHEPLLSNHEPDVVEEVAEPVDKGDEGPDDPGLPVQ